MNKELLQRYVALRVEIKALEEKETSLKQEILAELNSNKIEKINTDFGSFTVCKKLFWTYSPKVKAIEDRLKLAKITEQEKEIAKSSESKYLMFKESKDDNL